MAFGCVKMTLNTEYFFEFPLEYFILMQYLIALAKNPAQKLLVNKGKKRI